MDSHQRISGILVGMAGLMALIGIASTVLPYAILDPLRTLRDLTSSIWSMLFVAWFVLGLVWCALALAGGWRAWQRRADARRPLQVAALPLLLVFPVGTALGVYLLWAYRQRA
ncbi:MAG: hypothetical protein J0L58_10765 [Burkholderiales bacterium]|uniref:hypothetical protein n=1 Tax=Inhella sp. TaxID=1921806 RepID=UPI001AC59717|nr:hypothetical protein [Burkholderiales bacterium]